MQSTVRAHDLATLLDHAPASVRVLSLDCFDTLIWRNTQSPSDVWSEIDLPGGGREPRGWAEAATRRLTFNRSGSHEIDMAAIYRRLLPAADAATIDAAIERELAMEVRHAFAFAPTVELIRAAKRRGMRVVIVSDMYMNEGQLTRHIAAAAGADVMALIDRVFVSADHDVGKPHGLFDRVIAALDVAPDAILHVGDNHHADYVSAVAHGIHAVHFHQFDAETDARLRMEGIAATMIDSGTRLAHAACQPHRAAVALREDDDPAYVLGHDTLGPILHTFATWLKGECDALAMHTGKRVRPLFMMRDGYMLHRVFDHLYPEADGRPVEISRTVAMRASIHDHASLERFLDDHLDALPLKLLARHLMLAAHDLPRGCLDDEREGARAAFAKLVRKPEMRRRILQRTRAFGEKMLRHIAAQDVVAGDAVVLVDIGYNGSVQNLVEPVLRERLGVEVAGRYVILREVQITGLDKAGLLDTSGYEYRMLQGLTTCIAAIEQLCNVEQGSTVDYRPDGSPVREVPDMKAAQNDVRRTAQRACLDFVARAGIGVHRPPASDDAQSRRRAAGALVARLFFLPNAAEVALYETFNHDVNMASNETLRLLDDGDARDGLRRRGMAYVNEKWRTYVPGELHRQGLPFVLSLFATSRFGLDLRSSDFEVGGIEVPVMLLTARGETRWTAEAFPTADGYYRLRVPLGTSRPTIGLALGQLWDCVQIEEASFARLDAVDQSRTKGIAPAAMVLDGMREIAPGVHAVEPEGFLLAPPPVTIPGPAVLTVVFRPLHRRGEVAAIAAAA